MSGVPELPQLRGGPYRVITADPPWVFTDALGGEDATVQRGAQTQYDGLTVPDLCRMPVGEFADPDGAVLGLWFPAAQPRAGLEVMEAWGFVQKQIWVWVKTGKYEDRLLDILEDDRNRYDLAASLLHDLLHHADPDVENVHFLADLLTDLVGALRGPPDNPTLKMYLGRIARACKEVLYVGVRGRYRRHLADRGIRDVFFDTGLGHSIKTEKVQDALDRMFPDGNRLEIFARRHRPGWDCIGNESPMTKGEDVWRSLRRLVPPLEKGLQLALNIRPPWEPEEQLTMMQKLAPCPLVSAERRSG